MAQVTFISTVLNEANEIQSFLDSLAAQTRKPEEIIIVDAGSIDGTQEILKRFTKLPIKLIIEPGNIAHGRNTAIQQAKSPLIAVSDVGCILHTDWMEKILLPFGKAQADVSSGYYIPTGASFLQKCLAVYTSAMPDRLNPSTFLPSSRSIAFTKSAWEKVGGYPEELNTAEDLVFARNLKNYGLKMMPAFGALVDWPQRTTWLQAFWQFFRYAQGDGKAFYFRKQTPILWVRVILGVAIIGYALYVHSTLSLWLFILYSILYWLFSVLKNFHYVPHWKALIYLPLLQIVSDSAVSLGMLSGFIQRYEST